MQVCELLEDQEGFFEYVSSCVKKMPEKYFPDEENLKELYLSYFGNPLKKIFYLRKDNKTVGIICCEITSFCYLEKRKMAIETLFFIENDYRGMHGINALLDAYEEWAQINGCTHVHLSRFCKNSRKNKRGYRQLSVSYIKKVGENNNG